jgi:hypothetical protein
MPEKVQKSPLIKEGDYTVAEVKELAFFDMTGAKAGTQGTSNKSYHAELQISKKGDDKCQIYTIWGPTGAANQTREWRHYSLRSHADKDFAAIIKSKTAKGYKIIDVAQRAQGSDAAKAIVKAVILKGAEEIISNNKAVCILPIPTQMLVKNLFGSTAQFVATTLKCPLGQLSNAQIDCGRDALNKAKDILNNKSLNKSNLKILEDLTNDFYGNIPHNLGQGSRGQMTHLLFDDINKVVQKESDLDTLWDAKSVGAVLNTSSSIDAQYQELNADLTLIDQADPLFKFMSDYFHGSKVSGHGYGSAKVKNLWRMERKDKESDYFLNNLDRISKECGKHSFAEEAKRLSAKAESWIPSKRPDLDSKMIDLFHKSNTWLCWHGTRSANVVGITKRGLMIRPAGAVHTGSMFGDGKYFAWQSTKSLNYTDGGYWTGGKNSSSSRFMFLLDVSFGNMCIAPHSQFYRSAPKGYHSVYGKAGKSGVMNDEMITYDFNQKDTQSRIRYLFEISDN